jgi:hypothetical protein
MDVSDSLSAEQRALVEESVIAIVENRRANLAAARAQAAELEKLETAINEPLHDLIRQHPAAADALHRVREYRHEPLGEFIKSAMALDHVIPLSPVIHSVQARVPPYDVHWAWRDSTSAEPHSIIGGLDGSLGMDARSGNADGAADRFVSSHTGVGCVVHIDRPVILEMYAQRSSRYAFNTGAIGLSANATSEGGLETTLMRGSTFIQGSSIRTFRSRVSSGEQRHQATDWTDSTFPNGMGGRIEPGEYVFNVGIYTFTDFSTGLGGSAAAQSLIQSEIHNMSIVRR